jgi:hypothetical protein
MDREDLAAGVRASFKDCAEHLLLNIERFIKPGTGVEADLADVARLRMLWRTCRAAS